MKVNKRIRAIFVCILVLITISINAVVSMAAYASNDGSVTVILNKDEVNIPSVEYKLYKVATVSQNGKVSICGEFSKLNISFDDTNAETLRVNSTTLKGYVIANNINPDKTAVTDNNGRVVFSNLEDALYLIIGSTVRFGDGYIIPTPVIVVLPKTDNVTGEKHREIILHEKSTFEEDDELKTIKVLKVWKNIENIKRPEQITVELYKGNVLFDTAVLNKENNWKTEWTGLNGSDWSVTEKDVPDGFVVTIDQQLTRFVITNTYTVEKEESTTVKPGDKPTDKDEHTTGTDLTPTQPDDGRHEIPNTGQTWWPVLLCSCLGMAFIILGLVNRKYDEDPQI